MPLKKHFLKFLKHEPGKRFQHYYHLINRAINHNFWIKVILLLISAIVFLIGFILLFIPGPGIPFILVSLILFCLISQNMAAYFDRLEEKIRQWKYWEKLKNYFSK